MSWRVTPCPCGWPAQVPAGEDQGDAKCRCYHRCYRRASRPDRLARAAAHACLVWGLARSGRCRTIDRTGRSLEMCRESPRARSCVRVAAAVIVRSRGRVRWCGCVQVRACVCAHMAARTHPRMCVCAREREGERGLATHVLWRAIGWCIARSCVLCAGTHVCAGGAMRHTANSERNGACQCVGRRS